MGFLARLKTDFSDLYLNIIPFGMFMISIAYAGEAINIYTDARWESVFEVVISATLMFFSISFWLDMVKSAADDADE